MKHGHLLRSLSRIIEGLLAIAAVAFIIWFMWGVNYGQRKYEKPTEPYHVR